MTVPRLRTDEQASDHGRLAGRRVLVTGASGVVGRCVVPDLLREGASVVAISRNVPDRQQTGPHAGRHSRLELDLRARNLPPNEVATITDCIHLAAVLFPVSSATFFHDNIPITRNVVSALVRHAPNLQRFVHVSSLAARGPGASADYNDPNLDARAVSDYGESKYACETVVRSLLPERVHVAILRPGIVLSRDDHRLLLTAKNLRWTPSSVLARLPSAISAIAVEDLSQAIVAALASQPPLTGVFEIGHPEPVRVQDIAGRGARLEVEASLTSSWLMKTIAAAATSAARLTGTAPLLTFDKLREMQHASWCTDSTAFMAATGWQPVIHPMTFLQPYLR